MPYLVLVRHGKSEWNALGKWTGRTNVSLAPEGHAEARRTGEALADIAFRYVHVSTLSRTHQTAKSLLAAHSPHIALPALRMHAALDERDYGEHTGKNKWEARAAMGAEAFERLRRGWDVPIAGGETLKDVHARVVPYYNAEVAPQIRAGAHVLIVSHGNTLRALIKHLEAIPEEKIHAVEVGTGEAHCYLFSVDGTIVSKEIRGANDAKGKV